MLPAHAGVWVLANGDKLSGELVTAEGEFIEILHPQLGRLKLNRAALREEGTTRSARKADPEEEDDELSVEGESAPRAKGVKPARSKWKRQVELGYVQQGGAKDKQDLSLRVQFDGRAGANTFRATSRVLKSEVDDKTVTDRREAEFRWRHDLSKRLFTQAQTNYEDDEVRRVDLRLEQQLGGGYRVVDSGRQRVNVGLGAVMKYQQRNGTDEATTMLGSLFQDYSFSWSSRIKLVQEANLLVANSTSTAEVDDGTGMLVTRESEGNYRLKLNTALQSKVTSHMSVNLRYEYDYDRSNPEAEPRAEQRLTTSLGYLW